MNSLLLVLVITVVGLFAFASVAYAGAKATDWLVLKLQRL